MTRVERSETAERRGVMNSVARERIEETGKVSDTRGTQENEDIRDKV